MNYLNRFGFRYWRKWVGFRLTHYDYYHGNRPPRWSGFQLDLGWFIWSYHRPRHVMERAA